ncbi:uncharacterized protein LOC135169727 [Diachasmimorpha longicaudata]|uniref:uncharacterized protein LOC135169727 n=1 Tax=Diachasmimorpha longicaudata TaxID=58733 RepID=UPI0030B8F096
MGMENCHVLFILTAVKALGCSQIKFKKRGSMMEVEVLRDTDEPYGYLLFSCLSQSRYYRVRSHSHATPTPLKFKFYCHVSVWTIELTRFISTSPPTCASIVLRVKRIVLFSDDKNSRECRFINIRSISKYGLLIKEDDPSLITFNRSRTDRKNVKYQFSSTILRRPLNRNRLL